MSTPRAAYRFPILPEFGARARFCVYSFWGRPGEEMTGVLNNLSTRGLSATVYGTVTSGRRIEVKLGLSGLRSVAPLIGRVVWKRDVSGRSLIGCKFDTVDPGVSRMLDTMGRDYRACESAISFGLTNICKRSCTYWDVCKKSIKLPPLQTSSTL